MNILEEQEYYEVHMGGYWECDEHGRKEWIDINLQPVPLDKKNDWNKNGF